jgi:hypothetical protein
MHNTAQREACLVVHGGGGDDVRVAALARLRQAQQPHLPRTRSAHAHTRVSMRRNPYVQMRARTMSAESVWYGCATLVV